MSCFCCRVLLMCGWLMLVSAIKGEENRKEKSHHIVLPILWQRDEKCVNALQYSKWVGVFVGKVELSLSHDQRPKNLLSFEKPRLIVIISCLCVWWDFWHPVASTVLHLITSNQGRRSHLWPETPNGPLSTSVFLDTVVVLRAFWQISAQKPIAPFDNVLM